MASDAAAAVTEHCGVATRAFLQKEYAESLVHIQHGMARALGAARDGTPLDAHLVERLGVLRYTACVTVYTNAAARTRALAALADRPDDDAHAVRALLEAPAAGLYTQLWWESLEALFGTPRAPHPSSLEAPDTAAALALRVPGALLTSAILGALRLDTCAHSGAAYAQAADGTAARGCARQTCEMYLGASLADAPAAPDAQATYARVLRLYTIQVLGLHLHDWTYARDVVGYSRLPDDAKAALLTELDATATHAAARAQRERAALEVAQQQYEAEKRRRQAAPPPEAVADTEAPPSAPVLPSAAPSTSGAALRRTASVRRRGSGRAGGAAAQAPRAEASRGAAADGAAAAAHSRDAPPDTHAAERARIQAYLARRPSEPVGPVVHGSPQDAYVRYLWFGGLRRRAAVLLALVLAAVLVRAARARIPAAWARVAGQRVWDTLRMGTQVTYM
ncbi:hypothetical protein MBRA1_003372 [Malassezia brasiliensis]|uniref:Uncharacterized protein n=1 Tax=Malassezia brasiliensis TaxID=1821822 RepID=A0AAF0DVV9_9BASI|nr:hypothetical protein MBRA1_003372 [Malassezia brasiliensis]